MRHLSLLSVSIILYGFWLASPKKETLVQDKYMYHYSWSIFKLGSGPSNLGASYTEIGKIKKSLNPSTNQTNMDKAMLDWKAYSKKKSQNIVDQDTEFFDTEEEARKAISKHRTSYISSNYKIIPPTEWDSNVK